METEKNWVEENLEDVESVLCWSSDKEFLNYDGNHVLFHTIDRTALFLEEALILKKKKGVIVYPVNNADVAVPMCIEALYSLWEISKDRRKVLLVSQNLAVRELYWNLKVSSYRLNNVFPLGIIRADGSVKPQLKTLDVSRVSDVHCHFLHTSNPDFLPNISISKEIGCAVVDVAGLGKQNIKDVCAWADANKVESVILLESEQYSENFDFYASLDIPVWGWDGHGLQNDFQADLENLEKNPGKYSKNPFSFSVFHIKNLLKGIKREFIEINHEEINNLLKESLHIYYDIKKICKESGSEALGRAFITYASCKYSFERMLAPLQDIENHCKQTFLAKTLEKRIETLESWRTLLLRQNPNFASFWGKTYGVSKALYEKFKESGNPKYEKLKEIIRESLNKKESLLIFNYNNPYAQALVEAVERDFSLTEDQQRQQGIWITSITERQPEEDFDKCVIFGFVPFRASWLLKTACAKQAIFLVYPSEKSLLKHQFESEEKKLSEMFGRESRIGFLKRILGKNELKKEPPISDNAAKEDSPLQLSESETEEEEKFKPLLEDIASDESLIIEEEFGMGDDDEFKDADVSEHGAFVVNCCKITFDDNNKMFFRPSRKLPIFKDGKKLEYLGVRKARPGDLMIVVKQNIRNNLAQQIIKMADNHPKMQRLKFLVNSWVAVLRKGMEDNKDDAWSFLRKLQKIQEEEKVPRITNWFTIELWKDGYVIGPQESANIKLIGKIYNQKFLIDNYREIGAAITRLRGIHIRLLRKFNEMALMAGIRRVKGKFSDEVIDEEFNLHMEDFANIVSIHKIKTIEYDVSAARSDLDKIMR